MGVLAQEMANKKSYTHEQQDAFAIRSLTRAQAANGDLTAEIAPITVTSRKGDTVIVQDENPFTAKIDKIPTLRPAFAKDGTITAANSSSISDGASAIVVSSEDYATANGLVVLAEIKAYASHSQHPSEFTIAPVGAIEKVLAKTGWIT